LDTKQVGHTEQSEQNSARAFAALVIGLGREGTALARFLAGRGARVIVTDAQPAGALSENLASLSDLPVSYSLGGHPLSLLDDVDIVFVSPGVPLEIPLLVAARQRELPLSSETRLFSRLCPALVVGITGSSGKTTTTALVGEMLTSAGYRTWVGGNIGHPLIGQLSKIAPTDRVVMELSSFQLEFFAPCPKGMRGRHLPYPKEYFDPGGWSPPIAAILNITPNHLDRHATMDAYTAAKSHILSHQERGSTSVLNWDDPVTCGIGQTISSNRSLLWFSTDQEVSQGAFLRDDRLVVRFGAQEAVVCQTKELGLLGRHNVANALAACALVPEGSIVLLAGGRDKHLPWGEMARVTRSKVHHLVLFGESAGLIEEAVRDSEQTGLQICRIEHAGTLERAVEIAAGAARPGDVVLLSPGGTSFDAYRDFAERGDHFERLVKALE